MELMINNSAAFPVQDLEDKLAYVAKITNIDPIDGDGDSLKTSGFI